MKRSTLLLLLLTLTLSLSSSLAAKKDNAMPHDSVLLNQYASAIKAEQKAESAYTETQKDLQKASKTDTTQAVNKKVYTQAASKANKAKKDLDEKKAATKKLLQQLQTPQKPTSDSMTVSLWLSVLLGVLLTAVSLILGMRIANKRAKRRKATKNGLDKVDYAKATRYADGKKLEDKDNKGAYAWLEGIKQLTVQDMPHTKAKNDKKRRNSKAYKTPIAYLLLSIKVSNEASSIAQFEKRLKSYYQGVLEEASIERALNEAYADEGQGRRGYEIPLLASIKERDGYTESVVKTVKDKVRFYFKPFPEEVNEHNTDTHFAELDQLLLQLKPDHVEKPQTDVTQDTADATADNQTKASSEPDTVVDKAATMSDECPAEEEKPSPTIEWNGNGDSKVSKEQTPTVADTPNREPAPVLQNEAAQGFSLSENLLQAILKARETEKEKLKRLLQQETQATSARTDREEMARQLAEERANASKMSEELQLLQGKNAELGKQLQAKEKQLDKAIQEQKRLTDDKNKLQNSKTGLQQQVYSLEDEVKHCKVAQESYRNALDFWPELQDPAKKLQKFLQCCKEVGKHAGAMASYTEGGDEKADNRNDYLVRIARKMHEKLALASDVIEPLRSELPLLVEHQMVRTDGWIYTQLHSVKANQRAATLFQLIEQAIIQVLNATVIAADEYAYWMPEMLGVSDKVTQEFTPLCDAVLTSAAQVGLKVQHVQPFTKMDPTYTQNVQFWPNDKQRWQPGTVIEVLSLAINGSKAQVKATK